MFLQQLAAIMCHSDRTDCCTRVSPNRKEAISLILAQFYHMPGRYERVCVGWHCAKVKGHAELKIEKPIVKTFIYDFPHFHHASPGYQLRPGGGCGFAGPLPSP